LLPILFDRTKNGEGKGANLLLGGNLCSGGLLCLLDLGLGSLCLLDSVAPLLQQLLVTGCGLALGLLGSMFLGEELHPVPVLLLDGENCLALEHSSEWVQPQHRLHVGQWVELPNSALRPLVWCLQHLITQT
jgi:hypothetical protein